MCRMNPVGGGGANGAARRLFELVARAPTEQAVASAVMDHAESVFASFASGFYVLSDAGPPSQIEVRGLPDVFVETYEREGRDIDPVLAWVAAHHAPSHTAHALPEHEWMRSDLYRRVASRWGTERYMLVPILVDGAMMGTLNFGRRLSSPAYEGTALADASALCAHVSARITALRLVSAGTTRWHRELTGRELDIAEMVGKGLTNAEIAALLRISPNTVKKALKAIFHKLGCARRAELAAMMSTGK